MPWEFLMCCMDWVHIYPLLICQVKPSYQPTQDRVAVDQDISRHKSRERQETGIGRACLCGGRSGNRTSTIRRWASTEDRKGCSTSERYQPTSAHDSVLYQPAVVGGHISTTIERGVSRMEESIVGHRRQLSFLLLVRCQCQRRS